MRVCLCVCACVCANRHCTVVLILTSGLFLDSSPVNSAVKPRGRHVTADVSAQGVYVKHSCVRAVKRCVLRVLCVCVCVLQV